MYALSVKEWIARFGIVGKTNEQETKKDRFELQYQLWDLNGFWSFDIPKIWIWWCQDFGLGKNWLGTVEVQCQTGARWKSERWQEEGQVKSDSDQVTEGSGGSANGRSLRSTSWLGGTGGWQKGGERKAYGKDRDLISVVWAKGRKWEHGDR